MRLSRALPSSPRAGSPAVCSLPSVAHPIRPGVLSGSRALWPAGTRRLRWRRAERTAAGHGACAPPPHPAGPAPARGRQCLPHRVVIKRRSLHNALCKPAPGRLPARPRPRSPRAAPRPSCAVPVGTVEARRTPASPRTPGPKRKRSWLKRFATRGQGPAPLARTSDHDAATCKDVAKEAAFSSPAGRRLSACKRERSRGRRTWAHVRPRPAPTKTKRALTTRPGLRRCPPPGRPQRR